jgi:aminomethyltransferase
MDLQTPLYDCHLAAGGSIVPFAGYLLPVNYPTGIIAEHNAVRTAAGLFDVSHMGEIIVSGADALKNINYLFTNDFTTMTDGQVRYSPMCNETGGCVDDLLVYRHNAERYLVVVNASNRHKDFAWMQAHAKGDVRLEDVSDTVAQIAIQGPAAHEIMLRLVSSAEALPAKYYTFRPDVEVGGIHCLVSWTGYTGENGYEIYLSNAEAPRLWNLLLEAGKDKGLIPCGLGARDTLRLEAAMPLYGHEMDGQISPLETGLAFGVKMAKDDFVGKSALVERGEPKIRRIGLKITGRGIAREHQAVYLDGVRIGATTSGTHAPYLKYPVAMALIEVDKAVTGATVQVEVRENRLIDAEIVPLPFYKKT